MINATAHGIAKHAEKSEDEFSHFFSLSHTTVILLFQHSFIHSVLPGHLDYDLSSNVEIIFNTTSPRGGSQGSKHPKPGSLLPCPQLANPAHSGRHGRLLVQFQMRFTDISLLGHKAGWGKAESESGWTSKRLRTPVLHALTRGQRAPLSKVPTHGPTSPAEVWGRMPQARNSKWKDPEEGSAWSIRGRGRPLRRGKGQGLQVNSRSPDHPRLHRPSSQTPAQTEGCSSQTLGSPLGVFDSADWRGGLRLCISNPLPWEAGTALQKPPLRTTALRPEQGVWISRRGHGRQIIRDRK